MMKKNVVIKVERVSKKFCKKINQTIQYGLLDIGKNILGIEGNANILRKEEFWALNNVSFEIKKGETLGIIGANGSGKSTLLKLLNGIMMPDKGKITVKGKVGALIAIGAGFHPMLTGRENIYINGTILGMSRKEIDRKFDEIIDFADIGDFLDTPVKNYSSGMYVRLGFAVAVHSEPDILLVDEVLSVGDVDFQKKSLQKMQEIAKSDKVVIFVSHNLESISSFTQRAIYLKNGQVQLISGTNRAVRKYLIDEGKKIKILKS
jgi:lipopolysaccharide transport system ATP-binding protein